MYVETVKAACFDIHSHVLLDLRYCLLGQIMLGRYTGLAANVQRGPCQARSELARHQQDVRIIAIPCSMPMSMPWHLILIILHDLDYVWSLLCSVVNIGKSAREATNRKTSDVDKPASCRKRKDMSLCSELIDMARGVQAKFT